MSNHTPGPWLVKGTLFGEWSISSEFGVEGKRLSNGRQHIANSPSASSKLNPEYFAMFMANARLIAAAPDLLAALEAAVECGMVPSSSTKDGGATRHSRQVAVADMIRAAIAKARVKP